MAPAGAAHLEALQTAIEQQVFGKRNVVELALICVLTGGHLLLEDVPGVGKTTLALAIARALGGSFARIQFTSDLLPSDILGASVLDAGELRFRPGPIFANVILADELNRTPPRTQSALLEAMNEGQVSVDGETRQLPTPFLVIATQNPYELYGTWPLPDAQLDRFLLRTTMGYPDREAERAVLRGGARRSPNGAAVTPEQLHALRTACAEVRMHAEVEDYILDIVAATRQSPALTRGVSTRGAEALARAARGLAMLRGRDHVLPDDVRVIAPTALTHRVQARAEGVNGTSNGAEQAIDSVLASVKAPV
jgi:MoxR-like ATPase